MTTPVSDSQVVLAKFLGSYLFYLAAFMPMLSYPFILERYTHESIAVDIGGVLSLGLGITLFGAFFMALGCFASSLTRSQIVAAMITFAAGTGLYITGYLSDLPTSDPQWWHYVLRHTSMLLHMEDFSTGILDTRHIFLYFSLTGVFLFLTCKSVESRRWK